MKIMAKSVSYRSAPRIGGSIHVEDWKWFIKSFRDPSRSKLKDLGLSSIIDVKKMAKETEKVLQKPCAIPMPHKRQEIQLENPICELRNWLCFMLLCLRKRFTEIDVSLKDIRWHYSQRKTALISHFSAKLQKNDEEIQTR